MTSIARPDSGYDAVLADVVSLIEAGRRAVVLTSNVVMTTTYWGVGRRIVEEAQHGKARADYGVELVSRLAVELTARIGRGFGQRNVTVLDGSSSFKLPALIPDLLSAGSLTFAVTTAEVATFDPMKFDIPKVKTSLTRASGAHASART